MILKTKSKINMEKIAVRSILIASILFTIMGMIVKELSYNIPVIEVAFARNLFGLIWLGVALIIKPPKQKGGKLLVLIFRGVVGGSAMMAYFYNMSVMPLGSAYAFSYTSPIFLAFLSMILIHQKVSLKTWVAIFLGFSGILLISNPQEIEFTFWNLTIGLYSGIGAALAYLSVAELAKYYDGRVIILSLMLFGSILPLIAQLIPYSTYPIALFEPFVMPSLNEFLLFLALGVVSTYAQIYMTKAYMLGDPPIIGAISYITIFFATFAGVILGDKIPHFFEIIGMGLIVCGGILAVFSKVK